MWGGLLHHLLVVVVVGVLPPSITALTPPRAFLLFFAFHQPFGMDKHLLRGNGHYLT